MNTILIRQAVLSDVEALAPLLDQYRQFYGRESDLQAAREFLLARFDHGESVLFIAYEAGTPAGFVQLYPSFSSASLARTFILNDLFVIENCRRKKVTEQTEITEQTEALFCLFRFFRLFRVLLFVTKTHTSARTA